MATARVSGGSGGIDPLVSLMTLLGGTNSTTSADTGPLKDILKQLQGADYTQLLQSIFQDAQAQMPGLTTQFQNAMGSRSSSNGGLAAALQNLLSQTTLKGQQQIAQQQLQNQQLQVGAARGIADNTRNTHQQVDLLRGGLTLGGLAGINKLGSKVSSWLDDGLGGSSDVASGVQDFGGFVTPGASAGAIDAANGWDTGVGAAISDFGAGAGDWFGEVGQGISDWWNSWEFADGGLVQSPKYKGYRPKGYADGGQVTINSPGGRSSGAPTYTLDQMLRNVAQQGMGGNSGDRNPGREPSDIGPQVAGPGFGMMDALGIVAAMAVNPALGFANIADRMVNEQNALTGTKGLPVGFRDVLMTVMNPQMGMLNLGRKGINALGEGANNSGMTEAQMAEASTGVQGINSGGLGGMGISMGLMSDSMGSIADAAPGDSGGGGGGYGEGTGSVSDPGDVGYGVYRSGGSVQGPGTGTSDSIPARLSDGEFVIPADVVKKKGTEFFQKLIDQLHEPAAAQNRKGK